MQFLCTILKNPYIYSIILGGGKSEKDGNEKRQKKIFNYL